MYFLRRRHCRKEPLEAIHATRPVDDLAADEPKTPKATVVTKAKRARTDSASHEESKPPGTFRLGTLHKVKHSDE